MKIFLLKIYSNSQRKFEHKIEERTPFYWNQSVSNRYTRLKKENTDLKYQSAVLHESQQQQMVRSSEDALVKERAMNTNKRMIIEF